MSSELLPASSLMLYLFSSLTLGLSYGSIVHKRSADSCLENTPRNGSPVYRVDDTKFCQCCDPGFYKVADCDISGKKAVCMPCEAGYYSNTTNRAIRCSLCTLPPKCSRPNTEVTKNCTRSTNFDCRCKDGYHFKLRPGSNGDGDCKKHNLCPQGMYIERKGTPDSDTHCRPCENASQTDSKDYNISCSNQGNEQECAPTDDINCPEKKEEIIEQQNERVMIWIIAVAAILLIAMFLTVIVLYYLRRKGIFDVLSSCKKEPQIGDTETLNGDNQQIIYAIPRQTSRKCETIPYLNTSIEDKEFIRPLQRSPFDGRFDYAEVSIRPNAECLRKQWKECLRWLSNNIHISSWRDVIRNLIVQMDGDHDGDSIIDEVVANNPGNVREQIYNAFLNWYQMTCPEKLDLFVICEALEEKEECCLAQKLKEKYPDLLKRNPGDSSTDNSNIVHEDESLNHETPSKFVSHEDV